MWYRGGQILPPKTLIRQLRPKICFNCLVRAGISLRIPNLAISDPIIKKIFSLSCYYIKTVIKTNIYKFSSFSKHNFCKTIPGFYVNVHNGRTF